MNGLRRSSNIRLDFSRVKFFLPAILFVLITQINTVSYAGNCLGGSDFEKLTLKVSETYAREVPFAIDGEPQPIIRFDNSIRVNSSRFNWSLRSKFEYSLIGQLQDGEAVISELIANDTRRGATKVSGRWSMFLDWKNMMEAIETMAGVNNVSFLESGRTVKIRRENVDNIYIREKLWEFLGDTEIRPNMEIEIQDTEFYNILNNWGTNSDGTTFGHNGTQTKGFIFLLIQHLQKTVSIDKVVIKFERGVGTSIPFDIIYHISSGSTPL